MAKKRKRRRGRPKTGQDPVVPVRLPEKLLRDIDAWGSVYRNVHELEGMNRSTAIRCLILLGLERVQLRVIDPKDKTTFKGATLPLLKFFRRPTVGKWLAEGTAKTAKLKPPAISKQTKRTQQTRAEVIAAADRAVARSKERKS